MDKITDKVVCACLPIKIQKNNYIYLNLAYNFIPIHSSLTFIIKQILILFGITILLYMIIKRILRSLVHLEKHAHSVARGNLSERIVIKTNDEIGELGRVFNIMSSSLENLVSGLKETSAHISHELRTPLTRILLSRELLEEKLDNYEKELFTKHLKLIEKDISQMENMIDRILTLSKIDLPSNVREWEKFNIIEIIEHEIEKSKIRIKKKQLQFEYNLNYKVINLEAVKAEIELAISSIFDNAIKYTPPNNQISLSVNKNNEYIKIELSNHCPTMNKKYMQHIFDPFYRSNSNDIAGSGLGLAISKKYIENNGGKITGEYKDEMFTISIMLLIQ